MTDKKLPTSPDWSTAPEWAQYFAIDKDGQMGWFYEKRPIKKVLKNMWYSSGFKKPLSNAFDATNWQNSLQKRPD